MGNFGLSCLQSKLHYNLFSSYFAAQTRNSRYDYEVETLTFTIIFLLHTQLSVVIVIVFSFVIVSVFSSIP